ncbi:MAG: hypothetical protein JWL88_391 [Parcubacteria group bacterium]|nr:hypothetical protein [Parcubacteria group bacterium]
MDSIPQNITSLWEQGFFKEPRSKVDITEQLTARGVNGSADTIGKAISRSSFLVPRRSKGTIAYIQNKPAVSRAVDAASSELFDEQLIRDLGKPFEKEIDDLRLNFGKSGTCTAFLLRKVLEKLIYIGFAKQKLEKKLEDSSGSGRLVGLEAMINIASKEKVHGIPFITPATAKKIEGIKFLGDVSAHNPLVNIDMKDVIPQMPFIITAYKELVKKL